MSFTEAALIVLYVLQEAKIPLNLDQISQALDASSEYTYLDGAIAINDMLDKKLVIKENNPMGEFYRITLDGRISLAHLKREIRGSIRNAISDYIKENFTQLNLESKIYYSVNQLDSGEYQIFLRAYDKDLAMNDILLIAKDEEQAKLIITNWERNADKAIAALYSVLMMDI